MMPSGARRTKTGSPTQPLVVTIRCTCGKVAQEFCRTVPRDTKRPCSHPGPRVRVSSGAERPRCAWLSFAARQLKGVGELQLSSAHNDRPLPFSACQEPRATCPGLPCAAGPGPSPRPGPFFLREASRDSGRARRRRYLGSAGEPWGRVLSPSSCCGVSVMQKFAAATLAIALVSGAHAQSVAPPPAQRASIADAQVVAEIIRLSRARHSVRGPCTCPDDRDRDGRVCGRSSAYSRSGGPLCYPRDVTTGMIADYRAGRLQFLGR